MNLPEKYYKFHAEKNDFSYGYHSENDADGNPKYTYRKYAAIFVEPDPSVANERSIARLYQLIYVWTQQNPIVYGGTTMILVPASDSPVVIEELDTPGDVNSDGYINAVDASSVLSYYARISTNQEGGYDAIQKLNADVNQDRLINAVDASNILAYYAYASTTKEDIVSLEAYMKK
ncbi:dockerin type I domain-containing protein [Ruminococcus sp.]|uniref:dockerin type I domain-containing protein n=1 Tax=Ruminococcus sp. TaxID=41978 RepID=UPI0025FF5A1F|nr:dockerin type I domain-containing protein [Ruminococcus sp.]